MIESIFNGNATPHQLVDFLLIVQLLFLFAYFLSAFFLISNDYAGFVGLFLGIIYLLTIVLTYRVLRKDITTRTSYGILLGVTLILIFMSLESAIFWGQYAGCTPFKYTLNITNASAYAVECTNPWAMRSVSTFSVFLFLSYICQLALLIKYKEELLASAPSYDYSPLPTTNNMHAGGPSAMTNNSYAPSAIGNTYIQPGKFPNSVDI